MSQMVGRSGRPGSPRTTSNRCRRSRQSASSRSSTSAAWRTVLRFGWTSCSRPRRRLVTRSARSSTATCFCTAAKLIGYVRARAVTDHSPSTALLKCCGSGDFVAAWGGIASLQLGLAAVWTSAPARLVGLAATKGRIAAGADADLVVWDPDADFAVDAARLEHKNKVTPYHGRTLRGRVLETWLGGEKIYDRGAFPTPPRGRWLRRGAG